MKLQPVLVALTLLNVGILVVILTQGRPAAAAPDDDQKILRGRGLQIIDAQGKVRASVELLPASRQKDGTMSAETVLLRLITEKGRPSVKIGASEEQSGLSLTGPTGSSNSYIQALAGPVESVVVVRKEDGGETRIKP